MFRRLKKIDPRRNLSEEERSKEEWKVKGDDGKSVNAVYSLDNRSYQFS